jgi:PPOX class probable F420-dependent enzyme
MAAAALTDAQRAFLGNPFVASVTTVRPDGSLHTTVVWVGVDGEDVVFNTLRDRAKARHLAANPNVSLLVVDPADAYRWLAVAGRAEVTGHGAEARLDEFSRVYLGAETYPWRREGQEWVTVRIRPERIDSVGL